MSALAPATVGAEIRQLRLELGWSQSELARRMGVQHSTVWRWEHGRTEPHPAHYDALREFAPIADNVAALEEG